MMQFQVIDANNPAFGASSMETMTSSHHNPLADQWRFLRRLFVNPQRVGAVAPSSGGLARAMVAQMDAGRDGPILELGPGSGVMTRQLLASGIEPARLTVVERDPAFVRLIHGRFPGVNIAPGDAFDLDVTLAKHFTRPYAAVISGLPLLNFPADRRQVLIEGALAKLQAGAPFIQFSYGFKKPVEPPAGTTAVHAAFVLFNLPPAHVWVYRRGEK